MPFIVMIDGHEVEIPLVAIRLVQKSIALELPACLRPFTEPGARGSSRPYSLNLNQEALNTTIKVDGFD